MNRTHVSIDNKPVCHLKGKTRIWIERHDCDDYIVYSYSSEEPRYCAVCNKEFTEQVKRGH